VSTCGYPTTAIWALRLFPAAAQATTTTVGGAASVGTSLYPTVRNNSFSFNTVYISNFRLPFGAGGCAALYLRDRASNREIAGTGCIPGTGSVFFTMFGTGSDSIPKGSFTLDLLITGSCGVPGCGILHWSAVLHYNIQNTRFR